MLREGPDYCGAQEPSYHTTTSAVGRAQGTHTLYLLPGTKVVVDYTGVQLLVRRLIIVVVGTIASRPGS